MARKRKERWRQIPGFPDYDVSDLGRVRTWKSGGKPSLMKTRPGNDGYPRVTLQNAKGQKRVQRVHILVARSFLGTARGRLVGHKSRSKKAALSNLEYGSYMDNHRDKYRDGTDQRGEKNSQAELIRKHAKQIYKLKGKMTQQEIADSFGVSRQAVSDIHRGITWARVTGAKKR
ncbi:MAG: NUMOD4 domain-containing protein [Planctomycetota bacterium]